jgi:hypothetical protein
MEGARLVGAVEEVRPLPRLATPIVRPGSIAELELRQRAAWAEWQRRQAETKTMLGQYHAASDQVDEAKRVLKDLQQRVMLGIGGACRFRDVLLTRVDRRRDVRCATLDP